MRKYGLVELFITGVTRSPRPRQASETQLLHQRVRDEEQVAKRMWGTLPPEVIDRMFFLDATGERWHWHETRRDEHGHERSFDRAYWVDTAQGVIKTETPVTYPDPAEPGRMVTINQWLPVSSDEGRNVCLAIDRYVQIAKQDLYARVAQK